MRRRNGGNSRLPVRRRRGDPMSAYDSLSPELRRWLATAALPWSPRSALRAWNAALRGTGGQPERARARLAQIELRLLRRDCATVWGDSHPLVSAPR